MAHIEIPEWANVLFLDNDTDRKKEFREAHQGVKVSMVSTPESAIANLRSKKYDYVFLDHDLVGTGMQPSDEKSGFWVAQWLSKNKSRRPTKKIVLHSLNRFGRSRMKSVLRGIGVDVVDLPYGWK